MSYVRVSLIRPRAGEEQRVADLIDRLVAYYAQQPGFLGGYRLEPHEPEGYLGRIGIWANEEDADHAAQAEFDLALRSQLNMSLDEQLEYSFIGYEAAPAAG